MLDIVSATSFNTKRIEKVRLIAHVDCRKAWQLLTRDDLKSSKHIWYGGAIISEILALENNPKMTRKYNMSTCALKQKNETE